MTTSASDQSSVNVELPDDATAPSVARARTRSALGSWRLPGLLDPLLLVVSELVGNAVRHGRGPIGMLLLRRTGGGVRVEVHDEDSAEPTRTGDLPDDDQESGRGLFLVDALASETGVEQIPDDGKIVWATLEQDEPSAG